MFRSQLRIRAGMVRPGLGLGNTRNQAPAWFDKIVFRRALSLKLPFSIKELKTL